jgi:hypothetical protein
VGEEVINYFISKIIVITQDLQHYFPLKLSNINI